MRRCTSDFFVFPRLEATPDISRGEARLAAEVTLAKQRGYPDVDDHTYLRAMQTLKVMANG